MFDIGSEPGGFGEDESSDDGARQPGSGELLFGEMAAERQMAPRVMKSLTSSDGWLSNDGQSDHSRWERPLDSRQTGDGAFLDVQPTLDSSFPLAGVPVEDARRDFAIAFDERYLALPPRHPGRLERSLRHALREGELPGGFIRHVVENDATSDKEPWRQLFGSN